MAQRRMVSVKIIDSARFIKMPQSTQALYFHLVARADDDGIVEAFNVMRMIGAAEDDLKILVAKQFANILNEDLVTYITDWNEHNLIRPDRKIDSIYQHLLLQMVPDAELKEKKQRADRRKLLMDGSGTSHGPSTDGIGKVSLGEVSVVEESIEKEVKHIRVFDEWQSHKIHVHKDISKAISDQLNKLTVKQAEEVIQAIGNYAKAYKDTGYYYNNVWKLDTFIKQSNGYKNWLDEGKMWVDYNARKSQIQNHTSQNNSAQRPYGVQPAKPLTTKRVEEW